MSFRKEKRDQIKLYILEKIDNMQDDIARRTAEAFSISLNTVYRYIKELIADNIIYANGRSLHLKENSYIFTLSRKQHELEDEDIIYHKHIQQFVFRLPDNVQRIWEYCFMEMMNNAIEHSMGEQVKVTVLSTYLSTTIIITDDGIGIFRKIKDFYHYSTLDDAVSELFKGKLTTDSAHHSGEGIFFTSRILDRFAAISDGKVFTHDKYSDLQRNLADTASLSALQGKPGTMIYMELSNLSKKILREVFDMFSDPDGGFTRTNIPVKNIYETYPVSRSQAKRLCNRFDKFQEVILDFSGIEEIGQGFAHEIFVVFQKSHPDTKILPQNTSAEVKKMINHVLRS